MRKWIRRIQWTLWMLGLAVVGVSAIVFATTAPMSPSRVNAELRLSAFLFLVGAALMVGSFLVPRFFSVRFSLLQILSLTLCAGLTASLLASGFDVRIVYAGVAICVLHSGMMIAEILIEATPRDDGNEESTLP